MLKTHVKVPLSEHSLCHYQPVSLVQCRCYHCCANQLARMLDPSFRASNAFTDGGVMHPAPKAASPFSNFGTPRERTVLIVLDDVSPIEVRHLGTGLRCSKRRLHFELVQANATTRSVLVLDANDEPFARVEGVREPKHLCLIRIESGTIPGSKIRDENSLPRWIDSCYTSNSLPPLRVPIPHATPTMTILIPMPRQHVHQHLQHVVVHPPLWLLRVELVQRPSASTCWNRWIRGRFRLGPRRSPPPTLRHG